ncbi:hypothetical protein ElyMa_002748500 [Elysia marginata]|uniref:Uncharacterized protein n=1 Tax=Elysia marginata TaxID=1093978 RepID=A0AAV4HHG0_9GAST|nr:hypothetical protein ElyMa_002748500 [Elysia marginata]
MSCPLCHVCASPCRVKRGRDTNRNQYSPPKQRRVRADTHPLYTENLCSPAMPSTLVPLSFLVQPDSKACGLIEQAKTDLHLQAHEKFDVANISYDGRPQRTKQEAVKTASCDPVTPIISAGPGAITGSGNGQATALKPGVTGASGGGRPGSLRGYLWLTCSCLSMPGLVY